MKPTVRPIPRIYARAYEAATQSPKVADWDSRSYGPNSVIDEIVPARARSQEAVRNNPWVRRAVELLVSHEIGCGIQPRPKLEDADHNTAALALWNRWTAQADADGALDFYGLQALLSRARHESGEAFVRLRSRRPEDGLAVPLQLQVLESDLLPMGLNTTAPNGGTIRQGIERNARGQRVAYWFYREHPGDRLMSQSLNELSRVPAEHILHYYRPQRPGQLRGEPSTLSTLYRARAVDHFESAELARKKIRARFAGVIWKENVDENPLAPDSSNATLTYLNAQLQLAVAANDSVLAADLREQITAEREKRSIVDVEDGYMLQLALQERIQLSGGDTGTSGQEFIKTQLQGIAAGNGVPYELMSGDYSGTNDRIMRVILNAFYRALEMSQDLLTHQILQPIWRIWLLHAVQSGVLRLPGYYRNPQRFDVCEWRAHAWSYVNPLQEAETAVLKIKHGLTSRTAAVAESGWDVADIDAQQAADHQRESDLDLHYGDAPAHPAVYPDFEPDAENN